jgi:hypothetical protein
MHYMSRRSQQTQKHKFGLTCPNTLFVESVSVLPENYKQRVDISHPGRTRMHYVTHKSHQTQKQKFGVMCPDALFVESKRRTRMHYVTHRSHRMQKHKFSVTCPDALFVDSVPVPNEHETQVHSASTFHDPDASECTT